MRWFILIVWCSIQLFFISGISAVWWRLRRTERAGESRRQMLTEIRDTVTFQAEVLSAMWEGEGDGDKLDRRLKMRGLIDGWHDRRGK